MGIEKSNNWIAFNAGLSIGSTGSESGEIIFDIEHIDGARVTLEKITSIAPFAITLGVYGLMFHTHYEGDLENSELFIQQAIRQIDTILDHINIPEAKRTPTWQSDLDRMTYELAEMKDIS